MIQRARQVAVAGLRPAVAWPPLLAVAGAVTGVLLAVAAGYGYHRDELYFLQAGRHLAFGYVDQPPLTPLVARVATELFGDSLVGPRLFPAVAAGLTVLLTGLLAREFGGDRGAQVFAAACTAVAAYPVAVGHLLSTSAFDLLAWTAVSWLVVRALRGGSWVAVGVVAGIGLQNKALVAFLLFGLLAGLLLAGPRSILRTPGPWLAGGIALLLWSPFLVWQARHGWPMLALSEAIAGGSSGSSEPWWLFVPFQFVLVGVLLVPVWVAGWWRLARDPAYRAFPAAYVVLAVVFLVTGGKPYYLAGLYPVLLAAGADPVLRWASRPGRRVLLGAALAVTAAASAVLMLPLVPARDLAATPIPAIYGEAGEQVGWPELAATVDRVHATVPDAVVLTRNYGQAGAIDRFGTGPAYSGHNAYADWRVPADTATTAVVVGYDEATLRGWFGSVEPAARIDNGVGLDNDEQGTPVWVCRDRLAPWAQLWPQVRHIS